MELRRQVASCSVPASSLESAAPRSHRSVAGITGRLGASRLTLPEERAVALSAAIRSAERVRKRSKLASEAAALEADEADRAEMLSIA